MTGQAVLASLSPDERRFLDGIDFPAATFAELVDGLVAGTLPPNRVAGSVTPPPRGAIATVAPPGSWQGDALVDAGRQALHGGRAGLILLNGGMATRFGGRVKGIVDALPGRSFLALQAERIAAIRASTGRAVPLVLMNSFATDAATRTHLEENDWFGLGEDGVLTFVQSGLPRVTEEGTLHRDDAGAPSIYGPGHGDLLPSLRRSGVLAALRSQGIETLLMANVDNLGAGLEPDLLGHFLASGRSMMVEVAPKLPGDVGGAPAAVDGALRIVEGFAFPEGFDQDSVPVFNTNTLWFRTDALDREFPLRWYAVQKKAGGEPVVQFERLVGQASWFLDFGCIEVERARFLPVKAPQDLEDLQPRLRAMFGTTLRVL